MVRNTEEHWQQATSKMVSFGFPAIEYPNSQLLHYPKPKLSIASTETSAQMQATILQSDAIELVTLAEVNFGRSPDYRTSMIETCDLRLLKTSRRNRLGFDYLAWVWDGKFPEIRPSLGTLLNHFQTLFCHFLENYYTDLEGNSTLVLLIAKAILRKHKFTCSWQLSKIRMPSENSEGQQTVLKKLKFLWKGSSHVSI